MIYNFNIVARITADRTPGVQLAEACINDAIKRGPEALKELVKAAWLGPYYFDAYMIEEGFFTADNSYGFTEGVYIVEVIVLHMLLTRKSSTDRKLEKRIKLAIGTCLHDGLYMFDW